METSLVMHMKSMLSMHNQQNAVSGYRLMPNDVIKLGRVRFKVREIVSPAYQKKNGHHEYSGSKLD